MAHDSDVRTVGESRRHFPHRQSDPGGAVHSRDNRRGASTIMSQPHLIRPPVSTPVSLRRSRAGARELPDDLLKAASIRLGITSLLFAVLWVVGELVGHFTQLVLNPDRDRKSTRLNSSHLV